jgi:hypothetical protein
MPVGQFIIKRTNDEKKLKNATLQLFFEAFLDYSAIIETLGSPLRSRPGQALEG